MYYIHLGQPKYTITDSGDLLIKQVTANDAGTYRVVVQPIPTEGPEDTEKIMRTIKVETLLPASIIKNETKLVEKRNKTEVVVQCAAAGKPSPDISFKSVFNVTVLDEMKIGGVMKIVRAVVKLNPHSEITVVTCMAVNKNTHDALKVFCFMIFFQ